MVNCFRFFDGDGKLKGYFDKNVQQEKKTNAKYTNTNS